MRARNADARNTRRESHRDQPIRRTEAANFGCEFPECGKTETLTRRGFIYGFALSGSRFAAPTIRRESLNTFKFLNQHTPRLTVALGERSPGLNAREEADNRIRRIFE